MPQTKFHVYYNGSHELLELDLDDTISVVKLYFKMHFGIPPNEQILTNIRNLRLDDSRQLVSYYGNGKHPDSYQIMLTRWYKNPPVLERHTETGLLEDSVRHLLMPYDPMEAQNPSMQGSMAQNPASMSTNQLLANASTLSSGPASGSNLLHFLGGPKTSQSAPSPTEQAQEQLKKRIVELEATLENERKEHQEKVEKLTKEKNDALKHLEELVDILKTSIEPLEKELASKNDQLQNAERLNNELHKELEILNETMSALPNRLEADIGIEDGRVDELAAENRSLRLQVGTLEKKLADELQQQASITNVKSSEANQLTKKLDEANASILSLSGIIKNQEGDMVKIKDELKEKEEGYKENLGEMQENQAKLIDQLNALKSKWRAESRRIFNESIAYAQKSYKKMLAVEELGFLKSNEDLTSMKISMMSMPSSSSSSNTRNSSSMQPAESTMSMMTASSSYERINEGGSMENITGSQFWSVPEEVERDEESEKLKN